MTFIPLPGTALWIPTPIPSDAARHHLHFLLTGAPSNRHTDIEVVIVSVSSIKPTNKPDLSCVLNRGDHPSIHHPSFVEYRRATLLRVGHIQACLDNGTFTRRSTLDSQILTKIIAGAHTSPLTPRKIKKML